MTERVSQLLAADLDRDLQLTLMQQPQWPKAWLFLERQLGVQVFRRTLWICEHCPGRLGLEFWCRALNIQFLAVPDFYLLVLKSSDSRPPHKRSPRFLNVLKSIFSLCFWLLPLSFLKLTEWALRK